MKRIHLFEFEDQPWCPAVVREVTTDFLLAYYELQNVYQIIFAKILATLVKTNTQTIIDCCSGSGGPIKKLRQYLDNIGKTDLPIILTDKYPNLEMFTLLEQQFPQRIIAHKTPLDATKMPAGLTGMRTLFSSFHHFKPEAAVKILQDAVDNKAPIGIFEFTGRHAIEALKVLFAPIMMLFILPRAKRLNWHKFLFTYLLPLTPFTHTWEYLVSNLRTYSPAELLALVTQVNAPHYHWETGKIWHSKAFCYVTYLIGHPD